MLKYKTYPWCFNRYQINCQSIVNNQWGHLEHEIVHIQADVKLISHNSLSISLIIVNSQKSMGAPRIWDYSLSSWCQIEKSYQFQKEKDFWWHNHEEMLMTLLSPDNKITDNITWITKIINIVLLIIGWIDTVLNC